MREITAAIGSGVVALIAHIPCCAPTILLALGGGIGGSGWIAGLERYRIGLTLASLVFLGLGFYFAYRPVRKEACGVCARKTKRQKVFRGVLWAVAFLSLPISINALVVGDHAGHDHSSHSCIRDTEKR